MVKKSIEKATLTVKEQARIVLYRLSMCIEKNIKQGLLKDQR